MTRVLEEGVRRDWFSGRRFGGSVGGLRSRKMFEEGALARLFPEGRSERVLSSSNDVSFRRVWASVHDVRIPCQHLLTM